MGLLVQRQLRGVGVTILFVGNHVIDFDDEDHARGVVYCKGEIQDGERWISQAIQYRDTYERREGHWYFVRRQHLLWYGAEAERSPLDQPPANWPASHTGRGALPESLESWRSQTRDLAFTFLRGTSTLVRSPSAPDSHHLRRRVARRLSGLWLASREPAAQARAQGGGTPKLV